MQRISDADIEATRNELIEVLKERQLPALLAADILRTLCRDILCYFNTKDMLDKYWGAEIVHRIAAESEVGGRGRDIKVSWDDIVKF